VDLLRRGGNVIFLRHAATDSSQTDSDTPDLQNCQAQRNLTEQGRADARAIGRAVVTLQISVGQVLASPYCRTLETARLAFGRAEPTRDLLPTVAAADDAAREALVSGLQRLLGEPPAAGVNTILVSHQFSLQDAAGVTVEEGEAAVFEPRGAGQFRLLGRVPPEDWTTLVQAPG
jgi:phosphohistidine phosphatase SixA